MAQANQINLEIEEEGAGEVAPLNNSLHRLAQPEPSSRPIPTNRNRLGLGLGDRFSSVINEFRPFVEQARRHPTPAPRVTLPNWVPRNLPCTVQVGAGGSQREQSSVAHVNLGPNAQTYVVTDRITTPTQRTSVPLGISQSSSTDSNISEHGQEHPEINVSVNPANNNNIHDHTDNDSASDDVGPQQALDVRSALTIILRYAPFYLLLFVKFMYDCREGLFTFLILFCTFAHSNSLVRREHGKQINRNMVALLCEFIFTMSCIVIVHFLFGDGKLLPNVVMFPTYTHPISLWELMWLVVLTDLIVKIITVDIKILVTMMPVMLLPFQKRGKVYLFIEAVSQLYRSLLTIQPWIFYLMESYEGAERVMGMSLTAIYVVIKIIECCVKLKVFKDATWTLLQSVNLGTKPTGEQLLSAGDSCPICHDDYTTPVRLGCSHIFCELCIAAWLDREHTCPLCRAKVADAPTWRDGSTTHQFQLY
ncbi:hypothetical protein ACJJTC_014768 [Scirpophaga incertulas]